MKRDGGTIPQMDSIYPPPASSPRGKPNLVENGDMEAKVWEHEITLGLPWMEWSTEDSVSPSHSLMTEGTSPFSCIWRSPSFEVKANMNYIIYATIKTNGMTGGSGILIGIRWLDSTSAILGNPSGKFPSSSPNYDWYEWAGTTESYPTAAWAQVTINIALDAGTVWIDNVAAFEAPADAVR